LAPTAFQGDGIHCQRSFNHIPHMDFRNALPELIAAPERAPIVLARLGKMSA
jgi:hypothetical protein